MPYLTRKKTKATTKPWFSRLLRHPARKRSGSILGQKTHPGPTRGTYKQVALSTATRSENDVKMGVLHVLPDSCIHPCSLLISC